MQMPLQVTFRRMESSDALEERVRKEAEKLEAFSDQILGCQVVLEGASTRQRKGNLFHVRVSLAVRDEQLVASREQHDNHAHENAYVAVRDAFDAVQRQLEQHTGRRRAPLKSH